MIPLPDCSACPAGSSRMKAYANILRAWKSALCRQSRPRHGAPPIRALSRNLQFRKHVFAEQFDGTYRVGGEADGEHQSLRACGFGGERLRKTILRIAADRQPARQVIEQAKLLNQPDVGVTRPGAVAPAQFEQRRPQRL